MRTLALTIGTALFATALGCSHEKGAFQTSEVTAASSPKVLRHVVLFKYKDDAKPDQVQASVDAFRALPGKINLIRAFEWGTNVSPEHLDQGYTHVYFLTFTSAADRDAYLVHPAHKEFGASLGPVLDKVAVVDYWTRQ
ncbi:MAG: Dabb family protein [Phycisphaerae bacterium]|nr:Dabb family protein [Phycisphaerae bacterium]